MDCRQPSTNLRRTTDAGCGWVKTESDSALPAASIRESTHRHQTPPKTKQVSNPISWIVTKLVWETPTKYQVGILTKTQNDA
jgi:hypothetical protein